MHHHVNVEIVRFTDTDSPGWVECVLRDTSNREWMLSDKVPIFSQEDLDEHSSYPRPGVAACEIVREWVDEQGRWRCLIDLERPDGISTRDGDHQFEVFKDQVFTKIT